jgi:hypothetical protein
MFFKYVWNAADAILFIEGRVTFCRVDGTPAANNGGAPSCLIAYGKENVEILKNSDIMGKFIRLKE